MGVFMTSKKIERARWIEICVLNDVEYGVS